MYKSVSHLLSGSLRPISFIPRHNTTLKIISARQIHSVARKTPTKTKVMTTTLNTTRLETATCPVSGHKAVGLSCPFSGAAKASATVLPDPISAIPANFRNMTLSAEQKELVKASIPALEAHGLDITRSFYDHLIEDNPSLKDIFNVINQVNLAQPKSLADAVYAYAANIDNLTPLGPTVELIANKHASMYVRPEHYGIVGTYLLQAIQRILGDAVTPELLSAWEAAYWQLAKIFMLREDQLYREQPQAADWMDFRVAKKEVESDEITSFYLEPVSDSNKSLPPYLPGQYISVQVDVPSLGHRQTRQYSLSDAPNSDYYRISVKREVGEHAGLISNLMHDTVKEGDIILVSNPRGDFWVDLTKKNTDAPLVLISGGVGLTCLNSIRKTVMQVDPARSISWIHSARHSSVRAFSKEVIEDAQKRDNIQVVFFNSTIKPEDERGVHYHHEGYVDLNKLDKDMHLFLENPKAEYFTCGPTPFMLAVDKGLQSKGVAAERIHMELFGTGGTTR